MAVLLAFITFAAPGLSRAQAEKRGYSLGLWGMNAFVSAVLSFGIALDMSLPPKGDPLALPDEESFAL